MEIFSRASCNHSNNYMMGQQKLKQNRMLVAFGSSSVCTLLEFGKLERKMYPELHFSV